MRAATASVAAATTTLHTLRRRGNSPGRWGIARAAEGAGAPAWLEFRCRAEYRPVFLAARDGHVACRTRNAAH